MVHTFYSKLYSRGMYTCVHQNMSTRIHIANISIIAKNPQLDKTTWIDSNKHNVAWKRTKKAYIISFVILQKQAILSKAVGNHAVLYFLAAIIEGGMTDLEEDKR